MEMMTRELGMISDLQVGELLMSSDNLTLGFDATTQEGFRINSVHVTSKDNCCDILVDQLAGGTSEDYRQHICYSVDRVAEVYSTFNTTSYEVIEWPRYTQHSTLHHTK